METTPAISAPKAEPKDIFLHLLTMITLYVSAASFIALIFQYINLFIFDAVAQAEGVSAVSGIYRTIRGSLASLFVVFPVYVFTSRFLDRAYTQKPEMRNVKIRKWLIHLTLFAAALIIIGDLVRIIFSFLEGELTARFLLKALTVLFVAGSVFGYYRANLKSTAFRAMRPLVYGVIGVVLAAVIAGFFIAGSPGKERVRRFDDRRVQDLQFLQSEIVNYWVNKERLPESFAVLRDDIRGVGIPRDPETASEYEYRVVAGETFALCAAFTLPSVSETSVSKPAYPRTSYPYYPYAGENWEHGTGKICFERTIDKELYKRKP